LDKLFTHVHLSPRRMTWYWPNGGYALWLGWYMQAWQEVMAACHQLSHVWAG